RDRVSLHTSGRELRRLLRAVLAHAGTDNQLPALQVVLFDVDGDQAYVVATDRFTLGVARATVEPNGPRVRFTVGVNAADLATIVRTIRDIDRHVVVDVATAGVEITRGGIRYSLPSVDVGYPNWRDLLARLIRKPAPDLLEAVGVDPRMLARFHTTGRRATHEPLVIRCYGSGTAVIVTCGEWFLGAVMPVRLADAPKGDTQRYGHWHATLPAPRSPRTPKAA
ncbi:MAG: hypothetical protein ACRD0P_18995, partial [Stackebrandtia sp.]